MNKSVIEINKSEIINKFLKLKNTQLVRSGANIDFIAIQFNFKDRVNDDDSYFGNSEADSYFGNLDNIKKLFEIHSNEVSKIKDSKEIYFRRFIEFEFTDYRSMPEMYQIYTKNNQWIHISNNDWILISIDNIKEIMVCSNTTFIYNFSKLNVVDV